MFEGGPANAGAFAWEEQWLARSEEWALIAGPVIESAGALLRDQLGFARDPVKVLHGLSYAWDDTLGDPWPADTGHPDPERCLRIARVALAVSMLADRSQSVTQRHSEDSHVVMLCLRSGALARSPSKARVVRDSYRELARALIEVCGYVADLEGMGGRWRLDSRPARKLVWMSVEDTARDAGAIALVLARGHATSRSA